MNTRLSLGLRWALISQLAISICILALLSSQIYTIHDNTQAKIIFGMWGIGSLIANIIFWKLASTRFHGFDRISALVYFYISVITIAFIGTKIIYSVSMVMFLFGGGLIGLMILLFLILAVLTALIKKEIRDYRTLKQVKH